MALEALANLVDALHALAMIVWVLGLPLLFWHRYPKWSRAYVVYALAFVVVTRLSHSALGECVLTTGARELRHRGGTGFGDHSSFMVRLVNGVAGLRFTEESAILVWEWSVFMVSAGVLVHFYLERRRRQREGRA
ncbi:MAG: hypothetical protein OZ921_01130 [Sorangiineae bacterium]|nr:hypothetical protein [Polyangiaceae bacterium]MEB2321087.1 hypothetical protein [Sorangiineae bacterium]